MTVAVVYDGLCLLCIRSIGVLRATDVRGRLTFHDASDRATVLGAFPALRGADLDDAMYAVDQRGHVYRGFFAFRRLAWTTPFGWLLLPVLYLPGAGRVGQRVYELIARNRTRIGCRVDGPEARDA